ncbi:hypothetical protein ABIC65_002892 [Sphingomonas trueperi]|uniref:hypothetical protein n=1 Tax=Sphingomonas trueperi TaxID=53317 RepID=UPI00339934DF
MRKRLARALPILLALAPWPALADVKATYKAGIDQLTVEVADNGDARVQIDDLVYVRHGGEEYVTFGKFDGMAISGHRDDMLEFVRVMFRAAGKTPAPPAAAPRLEPLRETEVLGLKGQVWRIWPEGKDDPAASIEAAFSDSPRLAPVNRALRSAATGFFDTFAPLDKRGQFRAALAAMAEKGAPLMIGDAKTVQLLAVDFGPIAPARFAVPKNLASPEALRSIAKEMEEKRLEEKRMRGETP